MQYKACGAQGSSLPPWYMRIPSTTQRRNAPSQPLNQRSPNQLPPTSQAGFALPGTSPLATLLDRRQKFATWGALCAPPSPLVAIGPIADGWCAKHTL